jgi:hypothetical protein
VENGRYSRNLNEADFLALFVQVVYGSCDGAGNRAHGHNDPVRILGDRSIGTDLIFAPGNPGDVVKVALDQVGQRFVIFVVGFTEPGNRCPGFGRCFEAQGGPGSRHFAARPPERFRPSAQPDLRRPCIQSFGFHGKYGSRQKVHEGNAGFDGGQMGHPGQVHDFLDAAGADHGKAGAPAVHHVGVIAKNGKSMGTHSTGSHMQNPRMPLSGYSMHGGYHEHQSLG